MKIHNDPQGSLGWFTARLGIPTASSFSKIITPKGKPSAQADDYLCALLAERITNQPCLAEAGSPWMERGAQMENEARKWYELRTGNEVTRVGFCTRDDGAAGCSPDGLVGEEGLVEIKSPSAAKHVSYLLYGFGDDYRTQVQGQLWVTGRAWVDFMSYCPGLPAPLNEYRVRVERDEEFIAALESAVLAFSARLAETEALFREGKTAVGEQGCSVPGKEAPPTATAPKKRGRPKKVREPLPGPVTNENVGEWVESRNQEEVVIAGIALDEDPDFDPFAELDGDDDPPIGLTPAEPTATLAPATADSLIAEARKYGETFVKEAPPKSGTWWFINREILESMEYVSSVKIKGEGSERYPLATAGEIAAFMRAVSLAEEAK